VNIYAAGSGLDMLSQAATVKEIMEMTPIENPHLLYLGTATYDDPEPMKKQTQGFSDAGCTVESLNIAVSSPSTAALKAAFERAHIILASGGNTLYARDRWVKLGIDNMVKQAMENGTVLCGGSAGGILWFDGGHSDSMEASSYKNPPGPFLNPKMTSEEMSAWAYIRVPGISVLPGLFCPHYDVTEGNGLLRSSDFTSLLQRHLGEYGIGVDNWAAIMITADSYKIISRQGKPGSVDANGSFTANNTLGHPGAWKLEIDPKSGALLRTIVPNSGKVRDLMKPARFIVDSNMLKVARRQNPDDGIPPSRSNKSSEFHQLMIRTGYRFGN